MPEFVMEGRDEAARRESQFVFGFIEAMFFTETEPGTCVAEWFDPEAEAMRESGQWAELPGDAGYSNLHPDSLARIRADCEAWQAANADLLALAYDRPGYDEAQAGRDYWFTRNGHGVGFWDREELRADDLGEKLSYACRYSELNPFFGNHVTHGDAPFVHLDI